MLWLSYRRDNAVYVLFLNDQGLGLWFSTLRLFSCFVWVVRRASDKLFIITSIFFISYMEPLFSVPKTVGLRGSSAVNNFILEGLVNVVVNH